MPYIYSDFKLKMVKDMPKFVFQVPEQQPQISLFQACPMECHTPWWAEGGCHMEALGLRAPMAVLSLHPGEEFAVLVLILYCT